MSRIGKMPITIPDGVEVNINGQQVTAKGPLGTEQVDVRDEIAIVKEGSQVVLTRKNENRPARELHGLSRTLVANAINGVKTGFEKKLELIGVGYRANMQGSDLNLVLGYSHPILVKSPQGVTISVEANTKITLKGSNKQTVGDLAAEIRSKRPPEPYKGKGIKYEGEFIRRKAGKTGKK